MYDKQQRLKRTKKAFRQERLLTCFMMCLACNPHLEDSLRTYGWIFATTVFVFSNFVYLMIYLNGLIMGDIEQKIGEADNGDFEEEKVAAAQEFGMRKNHKKENTENKRMQDYIFYVERVIFLLLILSWKFPYYLRKYAWFCAPVAFLLTNFAYFVLYHAAFFGLELQKLEQETEMETKEAETDIISEEEKFATDQELGTKENHENGDGYSTSKEEKVQKKESYDEIQNDDEAQGPTNQAILEKIKTDIDRQVTKMQRMQEEMKSYHKEICKKRRENKFQKKSKKDNKEAILEEIKGISDLLKKREIREEKNLDDKLDTRLKKMREKYEEDEYKWEEEKTNLAAKLRLATESYEFYYGLLQDSEIKRNELINELHCATERAQLYRGILHDLDY